MDGVVQCNAPITRYGVYERMIHGRTIWNLAVYVIRTSFVIVREIKVAKNKVKQR